MRQNKILIAANSFDTYTMKPVIQKLESANYFVVFYAADLVAKGAHHLSISFRKACIPIIQYKNEILDFSSIVAAWYWRPNEFYMEDSDLAKEESFADEYRGLQRCLWNAIPDTSWINAPSAIRNAEGKLEQLQLAQSLGFTIPETIVSNDWQDIQSLPYPQLTMKMANGHLRTKKGLKVFHSTKFDKKTLPIQTLPYPGIWQPYITKKREWRITVIGNRVFDAAIYTTEKAKDDWRKYGSNKNIVQFKREDFPEKEKSLCIEFLKQSHLRYGAFDFIETPEGEIVFLECNPNGQYAWLEEQLGFPIASAFAEELLHIASRKKRED